MAERYDVAVVRSERAAPRPYVLATRGAKVILLEAGRMLTPANDFLTHAWPWNLKFRGHRAPGEYDGLW